MQNDGLSLRKLPFFRKVKKQLSPQSRNKKMLGVHRASRCREELEKIFPIPNFKFPIKKVM